MKVANLHFKFAFICAEKKSKHRQLSKTLYHYQILQQTEDKFPDFFPASYKKFRIAVSRTYSHISNSKFSHTNYF